MSNMSADTNYLDNQTYVERRIQQAETLEARIDAIAVPAARRFIAIEVALDRLRKLKLWNSHYTLNRALLETMLDEIISDLEHANQIRKCDTGERTSDE
jgi:hypothetical protein